MSDTAEQLLTPAEVARRLGMSRSWVNGRRHSGGGPPYIKVGGRVLYSPSDLATWIASRRRTSTSHIVETREAR